MIQLLEKIVIPAEAGTQVLFSHFWIPIFTGMTIWMRQQKDPLKDLKCYEKSYFEICILH